MKVLFQIRPDFASNPAGDSVQMINTKKYLERLGVRVDVSTVLSQDYRGYDIVHLFNLTRVVETYAFAYKASQYGIPIALSTIYWDNMKYYKDNDGLPGWKAKAWNQQNLLRKLVLSKASVLLPNSEAEAEMVVQGFNVDKPWVTVPNCVDKSFSQGNALRFEQEYGIKDFILCVGRISPRKNQLGLIKAIKEIKRPIVFIGPVNDVNYVEECKNEGGKDVMFISRQSSDQLRDSYAAARIHVLPSWFETPGLANLEAAAAGCQIVTTEYGSTREYFGDLAYYCRPEDLNTIKRAVMDALMENKGEQLRDLVLSKYTWENAAEKTLQAYRMVLGE
ncbi:MAG: Glycosyl transferase, group 1 [Firmicutes bacterium]|nr:Glycosyl transferase, group 1 [Bacillota bacterium]